jgi:ribulose-5-phosphate 4-epimerase/fuculose-1-phosphate aldolase
MNVKNTMAQQAGKDGIAAEEWDTRVQLAALYRLSAHYGWDELIYTHISARVPGNAEHFLLNPFGHAFNEVTASSLIKIDLEGNAVDATQYRIHKAGFVIHSAIHAARKDALCVIHHHTEAGMAVSMLKCGLLPLSQHAQLFHEKVGYHGFEGIANDIDERGRLAADLGQNWVLILRNHGMLIAGRNIPEAFSMCFHLEKACRAQLKAMATGTELTIPTAEVSRKTADRGFDAPGQPLGRLEWDSQLRLVDRLDSSYRD